MDNNRKIRLIQVAKEFKVGFNTLADYLQRKGLQSDCSPSSPVSAEVYAALEKEFGGNRQSGNERNAVRERIQQKSSVSLNNASQHEDEEDEEVVIKSNVISVKDEVQQPKILGKIDLDGKKPAPKVEEKPKAEEKPQSQPQQQSQPQPKAEEKPRVEEKPAEPEPLSAHTQKIQALRDDLLSKVRGQRHAVDEVVQGIFESQMFSALNPDRKGPLATFLFTGPSGVGKTFLASLCSKVLDRKMLVVDMSEYSDNLANLKFNGEHGQPAVVTGFVRENPNGIIVFDEVEKAHINTIYLFLQILDGARMMDHHIKREVSFKDNIIIMTTNAGQSLYEDATVCDLSGVPRSVILDALRKDVNAQTRQPYFPECITTRMANGRVILFNHLEPYALLQIIQDEIALQISLFEKSSGIKVHYDPVQLAALVLYNGGGTADARSLRGLAKNIVVRELQEVVMQLLPLGAERVDALKEITITIDTRENDEINSLFSSSDRMQAVLLTEQPVPCLQEGAAGYPPRCDNRFRSGA